MRSWRSRDLGTGVADVAGTFGRSPTAGRLRRGRAGRRLLAAAVLAAGLFLPACGGGGGGGGGGPTAPPPPPPPPPRAVQFTADAGAEGDNTISLADSASSSTTRFVVEVRATDVTDLYGVSFDLEFPNDLLTWDSAALTEGAFLNADGTRTELLASDRAPRGSIVIGYSRLGDAEGVDGTGVLFTLEFAIAAAGRGTLTVTETEAFDSEGRRLDGVTWTGGAVDVRLPS